MDKNVIKVKQPDGSIHWVILKSCRIVGVTPANLVKKKPVISASCLGLSAWAGKSK
jgi:hypothetical protein